MHTKQGGGLQRYRVRAAALDLYPRRRLRRREPGRLLDLLSAGDDQPDDRRELDSLRPGSGPGEPEHDRRRRGKERKQGGFVQYVCLYTDVD